MCCVEAVSEGACSSGASPGRDSTPVERPAPCRKFRVLNIVDDQLKFCPSRTDNVAISGEKLAAFIGELGDTRGLQKAIVLSRPRRNLESDGRVVGTDRRAFRHHRTQRPARNAFAESLNGQFRDGRVSKNWLRPLTHAREASAA
jgi:putative transposase